MTKDDNQLFRDLMKKVTPLKKQNRALQSKKKSSPLLKPRFKDSVDIMHDMLSEDYEELPLLTCYLEYCQSGVQKRSLKRLKQGKYKTQDTLDLHGLNVDKARKLINDFINNAIVTQFKCVQVIHGKGNKSKEKKPILKPFVNSWLRQKSEVLAFCSARQFDGGTGAVYVLLKNH